jgi:uncharacterized protein YbaP (TraB family)
MKFSILVILIYTPFCFSQNIGILWRITGNGLKDTSYIVGTNHQVSDSLKIPSIIKESILKTSLFYGESEKELFSTFKMMPMMFNPGLRSFERNIEPKKIERLKTICFDSLRMDNSKYKTWASFRPQVLATVIIDEARKYCFKSNWKYYSLDDSLKLYSKKNKVKVKGLEKVSGLKRHFGLVTIQEEFDYFIGDMFSMSLKQIALNGDDLHVKGESELCGPMELMTPSQRACFSAMCMDRNFEWIIKFEPIMKKKSLFIAVGMGHVLPVKYGLVDLLRAKGYTVECILKEFK